MTLTETDARAARRYSRKVAFASLIGNTIELYDFFIYGTAAALVFGKLFFPQADPLTGTLLAFGTYAVGFIARPLGGIVAGHFGDKVGRKKMLVLTLLLMGASTFGVGLLPTYDQVGAAAPLLLLAMRLIQGFSNGGEWGGAVLMATENAPEGKRGFYGSWAQVGVPAGTLIANGVFLAVSLSLSSEDLLAWGWRLPFLFSIVLVALGLWIRLRIHESPKFVEMKEAGVEAKLPIVQVFKQYPKEIFQAVGMRMAENGAFYIISTFVLTYVASQLKMPSSNAQIGVLIGSALSIPALLIWATLSDRVGRRKVYMFGALFVLVFTFPFFLLLNTGSPILVGVAVVLAMVLGHSAMYGPQAAYFAELFGTEVRYTGASLGTQLSSVLAGGLSPLIATALLAAFGWPAVAWYMVGLAVITVIALLTTKETYKSTMNETVKKATSHV